MTTDSTHTSLVGKVALVTGGGTGLGAAASRHLAGAGAAVAVNWSRSRRQAEEVVAAVHAAGGRALDVQADVSDEAAVGEMVQEVERLLGPVTLLVNNAGVTRWVPAEDIQAITSRDWQAILGVNLIGAWNCVRAVAPGMRAEGGAIVNVASDSVFFLEGSSIPYVVSKAALATLTEVLARTLAPGIRVNAVAPGWMVTPWLDRYLPEPRRAEVVGGGEGTVAVDEVAAEIVRLLADGEANGLVVRLSGD